MCSIKVIHKILITVITLCDKKEDNKMYDDENILWHLLFRPGYVKLFI